MFKFVSGSRRSLRSVPSALSAALVVAAGSLIPLAESPAGASELVATQGFESAFSHYELTDSAITPATVALAESRFEAAPVDEPVVAEVRSIGSGNASYYGRRFAGRRTASGETFVPAKLTAAHRTLPFGTKVKVTNRRNGQSVVVRINDRGPFHGNRIIDLSRGAAEKIGMVRAGQVAVDLALLDS